MLVYFGLEVPIIIKNPPLLQGTFAKSVNILSTSVESNPEKVELIIKFLKFGSQTLDVLYVVIVLFPLILK